MISQTATPSTSLLLYLHADQVVRPANRLTGTHVPGVETRVHLSDLAATIFAAAFWALRDEGLITLEAIKKKVLFVFPSTSVRVTVRAPQERAGLEGAILALCGSMTGPIDVHGVVRAWYGEDVSTPYQMACGQMQAEAVQVGCLVEVAAQRGLVAGLVRGRTNLDPVPERIADLDEQARNAIAWWRRAQAEEPLLFKQLLGACRNAIASRSKSDSSDTVDNISTFESACSDF